MGSPRLIAIVMGLILACGHGWATPPELPPWQREMNVVRLMEATAMLATARNPAEAAGTDQRLDDLYRQLAAKYPGQAVVRKAAGDHFWRTGNTAAAVLEWQAAQVLDPTDAETASSLGSAFLRDGRTAAAREQFQRAVDARPGVARYHFELANVLFLFRHAFVGSPGFPTEAAVFRDALAHFQRASELAAENVDFARAYAETFYGLPSPNWTEAFTAWEHVRALTLASPDFAAGHLARVSLRLGKLDQAEGYLDSIHDPAFAPVKASLQRQAVQLKQKAASATPTP